MPISIRMPRLSARTTALAALVVAGLCVASFAALPSGAATGSSVVTLTVPSATTLTATTCAPNTPATNLGTVLPGSTASTDGSCAVTFGSSNDTSRLRMYQADGGGDAMWRPPAGPIDGSIGGGTGITTQVIGAVDTAWYTSEYDPVNDRYYVGGRRDGAIVARYMPDGTLDTTWGGGDGWIVMAMGTGTTDSTLDIDLQPDGKIVGSGRAFDGTEGDRIGAFRLTAGGAPDPTFGGGDGWVSYDYGDPVGSGMTLQSDGKIVLVGDGAVKGGDGGPYAMRLLADGTPDVSFGNGDATPADAISFLYVPNQAYVQAVDADPVSGQVVVGGRYLDSTWNFATWRLNANGSRDMTWGGDGLGEIVTTNYAEIHDLQVNFDGTVYAAGQDVPGLVTRSVVVKFASNGTPAAWGASGARVLTPTGSSEDTANALQVLADGSLYVGGSRASGDSDGYVARLTVGGAVDTTFGSSGYVISAADATNDDGIAALVFGRDGRLVANGSTNLAVDRGTFAAWTAVPISDYGAGATWLGAGEDAFAACTMTIANATGTGWAADPCSTAADGAAWHSIPDDAAAGSLATTASLVLNGSVSVRFALRTLNTQPAGYYVAPITFELVAPL